MFVPTLKELNYDERRLRCESFAANAHLARLTKTSEFVEIEEWIFKKFRNSQRGFFGQEFKP